MRPVVRPKMGYWLFPPPLVQGKALLNAKFHQGVYFI